jgi:C1A family cysteine protease
MAAKRATAKPAKTPAAAKGGKKPGQKPGKKAKAAGGKKPAAKKGGKAAAAGHPKTGAKKATRPPAKKTKTPATAKMGASWPLPAVAKGVAKGVASLLRLGTGWVPEPPDPRDLTLGKGVLASMMEKLALTRFLHRREMPPRVDLSRWAGPVYFQGGFNTCNAHVVAGLVAYFEKKAHDRDIAASRLFLYKVAKNFLQTDGDAGVYIRQVMGVLKLVGVPPERYWPYPDPGTLAQPRSSDPLMSEEPPAFCYAVAGDYRAIRYYRLDEEGQTPADLLCVAKAHLAGQVPFGFGFPLYEIAKEAQSTGKIAYPAPPQPNLANHAVIAIGYDDDVEIGGDVKGAARTRGALRIKNSWSTQWGDGGYGWLPYEYVLRGHTRDFWTLLRSEWIDTGAFDLLD